MGFRNQHNQSREKKHGCKANSHYLLFDLLCTFSNNNGLFKTS